MTTGEGGIVTTNDSALAERVRLLINHDQSKGLGQWQADVTDADDADGFLLNCCFPLLTRYMGHVTLGVLVHLFVRRT